MSGMRAVAVRAIALSDERPNWRQSALCQNLDSNLFFPEAGRAATAAKRICDGCPVKKECLDEVMRYPSAGIWGGTSERERRVLKQVGLGLIIR